jgi:two-component system, NarL family, nitrate/nitrite response regulator NarL
MRIDRYRTEAQALLREGAADQDPASWKRLATRAPETFRKVQAMAVRGHIVLVERNSIYGEGLVRVLGKAGFRVLHQFGSVEDFLSSCIPSSEPQIVLLDLWTASSDVVSEVVELRSRAPSAKIVILSEPLGDLFLVTAFRSGVDGLVLKPTSCEALVASLELVMLGEHVFPMEVMHALATPPQQDHPSLEPGSNSLGRLSLREIEVLRCLSSGSPNKMIARRFGITEATVKVHVKAIFRKIPARNRTEAAIWAKNHLVDAGPRPTQETAHPLSF